MDFIVDELSWALLRAIDDIRDSLLRLRRLGWEILAPLGLLTSEANTVRQRLRDLRGAHRFLNRLISPRFPAHRMVRPHPTLFQRQSMRPPVQRPARFLWHRPSLSISRWARPRIYLTVPQLPHRPPLLGKHRCQPTRQRRHLPQELRPRCRRGFMWFGNARTRPS